MSKVSLSKWQTAQKYEKDFWESYADTYERYPQILLEHLAKLSDAGEYVREELSAPQIKEALEVGIGPLGIGVLGMRKANIRITGIDPLPRIRFKTKDEALDSYLATLRKRITYRCSPAETLPFDDECFDFVCCHNVIDHAHDPMGILTEIFRVLKNERCLYLTLNTFSYLRRLKFEGMRRLQPDKMIFACHPHSFLHRHVNKALSEIGYEIIRHEGGHHAIAGRGRLSRFLCRKPIQS